MTLQMTSTAITKSWYRQTFEIKQNGITQKRHTLLVNPQNMQMTEPARVNVVQTYGGAYVEDFGQGLITVSISGLTGYRAQYSAEGLYTDGYDEFKRLRNEIYRKFIKTNDPTMQMFWYDWENEGYYQIQPTNFQLARNVSQPTLYMYTFEFTCLNEILTSTTSTPTETPFTDFGTLSGLALTGISNTSEAMQSFGIVI